MDLFGYSLAAATILIFLLICLVLLVVGIFYLLTLQNTLKTISPENRKMPPSNVWLLLIPLVNIIYFFIVVDAVATSFKLEFEKYGVFSDRRPTYGIGLAAAILQVCSIIINWGGFAAFICWVIHWVKVNDCKNEILILHEKARMGEGEKSIFL